MFSLKITTPFAAHQWFKNGDHPQDNSRVIQESGGGEFLSEGRVVRRYNNPSFGGDNFCPKCGNKARDHGWIDQGAFGTTVCPGDLVISLESGYAVVSAEAFEQLFHDPNRPQAPLQAVSYSDGCPVKPRGASVRQTWVDMDILAKLPKEPTEGNPVSYTNKAIDQSEERAVSKEDAFVLDKIVAEFDMRYYEIAPKVMTCALVHEGAGLTVTGVGSCLDPDKYDIKDAKEHAYNDAAGKIHQFEQYRQGMNKHLQKTSECTTSVCQAVPALPEEFDIGVARNLVLDGRKVSHHNWKSADIFVFYVPQGEYPASRNGKGTLLGLYPNDMVPYDGYLAMKTESGSVVPWHPTASDMINAGWYLVK